MGTKGAVGGFFLVALALAVLILPLQWVGAMVFAAFFHELGHYLAIWCCGGRFEKLTVGLGGAVMSVRGMRIKQELLCTLAGPAFGVLLFLFVRWIPRIALCAGFQTLFNLLPIYPLDGGRILRCMLQTRLPEEKVMRMTAVFEKWFMALSFLLGAYGCFALHLGLVPLLIPLLLMRFAKKSCKSYAC